MNRQIGHLFVLVLVLFGLLVVYTSRWTVFDAKSLQNQTANRRPLLEQQRVPRGYIYADDGTVLARDVRQGSGPTLRYVRRYPQNSLFSNAVGYSFISNGNAGLEREENDSLSGRHNEFASIIDELSGSKKEGDDVRTTLDPAAQRAALAGLAGRAGSVVALDPSTGKVRVMANVPSYNPNQIPNGLPPGQSLLQPRHAGALPAGLDHEGGDRGGRDRQRPLHAGVDRVRQIAEDHRRCGPEQLLYGGQRKLRSADAHRGACEVGQHRLRRGRREAREQHHVRLHESLRLRQEAADRPAVADELTASGVFGKRGRLLGPSDDIDIGRVAIGQERLEVTPLQMALVAATVANGGKLMKAQLVDKIVSPDGRVRDTVQPAEVNQVMKPDTAAKVTAMMEQVVKSGTGTAAQIPGITVAGKTGTAEVDNATSNQAWFIAFGPVPNPKVAIAVTVERTQGEGGTDGRADRQAGHAGTAERAPMTEVADNTLVDGRYRILNRIGSGGMADVYCAEDTHLGRQVALKVLHRRFAQDQEFVERFRREASAAAGLQHPNVVERLRPRRPRRHLLHRDGAARGQDAQGPDQGRGAARADARDRPRRADPGAPPASRTSAG